MNYPPPESPRAAPPAAWNAAAPGWHAARMDGIALVSSSYPPDGDPDGEPAGGRWRRPWTVPAAAGLAGFLLGAAAVGAAWWEHGRRNGNPDTFAMSASVGLPPKEMATVRYRPTQCTGAKAQREIAPGTIALVYDRTDKYVGAGRLGEGLVVHNENGSVRECYFTFTVIDVPKGRGPYRLEVGRQRSLMISEKAAGSPEGAYFYLP